MEKGKNISFRFLLLLISIFVICGGEPMSLFSDQNHLILTHNQIGDIELEHQIHHISAMEDLKSMETLRFDFSIFNLSSVRLMATISTSLQPFSGEIWQPPKLV